MSNVEGCLKLPQCSSVVTWVHLDILVVPSQIPETDSLLSHGKPGKSLFYGEKHLGMHFFRHDSYNESTQLVASNYPS